MNTLIYLSLILFSGIVFGRLVKQAKLPNVTGYLLAGLILGPCILKLFPAELIENLSIISEIALGLIAFSIGSSFKWDYLKKVGKIPIVITVLEALFAVVFVVGGMLVAGYELPFALFHSCGNCTGSDHNGHPSVQCQGSCNRYPSDGGGNGRRCSPDPVRNSCWSGPNT